MYYKGNDRSKAGLLRGDLVNQFLFPDSNTHLFEKWYYLNPALRPRSWAGKESIYQSIKKALADPKRIKLKTPRSKITQHDGGIKEVDKKQTYHTITNFICQGRGVKEFLPSYRSSSISFAILVAKDSEKNLKDLWILDDGSDIHICNDSKSWTLKFIKTANKGDIFRDGNSSIQIKY